MARRADAAQDPTPQPSPASPGGDWHGAEPPVIPDPEALAAKLGADTLVMIVGGERTFLVAGNGSPGVKTRVVDAYREGGRAGPGWVGASLCGGGAEAPALTF